MELNVTIDYRLIGSHWTERCNHLIGHEARNEKAAFLIINRDEAEIVLSLPRRHKDQRVKEFCEKARAHIGYKPSINVRDIYITLKSTAVNYIGWQIRA